LKLIGNALRSNLEAVTDGGASRGAPGLLTVDVLVAMIADREYRG
jgi:hypothetical protein